LVDEAAILRRNVFDTRAETQKARNGKIGEPLTIQLV